MRSQWRMAPMGGPIGLDYTPILLRLQSMGLAPDDRDELFQCVRVIEAGALEQIRADQQ